MLGLIPGLKDHAGLPRGCPPVSAAGLEFLVPNFRSAAPPTGTVPVRLADSGSNGNTTPFALGASLVVIYRVTSPAVPLNAIVLYDGSFAPSNTSSIMTQQIVGFYQPGIVQAWEPRPRRSPTSWRTGSRTRAKAYLLARILFRRCTRTLLHFLAFTAAGTIRPGVSGIS